MKLFFDLRKRCKNRVSDLRQIDFDFIDKNKIKALVLDYDGVLAAEKEVELSFDVYAWLCDISKKIPTFILSNDPNIRRYNYFLKHFPEIMFLRGLRRKPCPDGLKAVHYIARIPMNNILIVDDRVLTGTLAASYAGTQSLLVYPAKTRSLSSHNFVDSSLRFIERLFFYKS